MSEFELLARELALAHAWTARVKAGLRALPRGDARRGKLIRSDYNAADRAYADAHWREHVAEAMRFEAVLEEMCPPPAKALPLAA